MCSQFIKNNAVERERRGLKLTIGAVIGVWLVGAICSFTVIGVAVYIAFHFLTKWW